MALSDLNDLFESVDGLTDDLAEYGVIAASAVGANIAFNFGVNFALTKFAPTAPAWVRTYGVPALGLVGGALAGSYLARYDRRIGTGVGVGLMSAGIMQLVKRYAPNLPLAGVEDDEALLGLGENLYERYLGEGVAGVNTTVEEQVSGLSNWQVEDGGVASSFS